MRPRPNNAGIPHPPNLNPNSSYFTICSNNAFFITMSITKM